MLEIRLFSEAWIFQIKFNSNISDTFSKFPICIYFSFFQTLSVEFFHLDEKGATNDEMKTYMISQGYKYHSTVTAQKNHANDYIFVHNSV
jgi:hypothetical protein